MEVVLRGGDLQSSSWSFRTTPSGRSLFYPFLLKGALPPLTATMEKKKVPCFTWEGVSHLPASLDSNLKTFREQILSSVVLFPMSRGWDEA